MDDVLLIHICPSKKAWNVLQNYRQPHTFQENWFLAADQYEEK